MFIADGQGDGDKPSNTCLRSLLLASIGILLIQILKSLMKCCFLFRTPKSLPAILQDFVNYPLFPCSLLCGYILHLPCSSLLKVVFLSLVFNMVGIFN